MPEIPLPPFLTVPELASRWGCTQQYIARIFGSNKSRLQMPWSALEQKILGNNPFAKFCLATTRPVGYFTGRPYGDDVGTDLLLDLSPMSPVFPWGIDDLVAGTTDEAKTSHFIYDGNLINVDCDFTVRLSDLCVDSLHIADVEDPPAPEPRQVIKEPGMVKGKNKEPNSSVGVRERASLHRIIGVLLLELTSNIDPKTKTPSRPRYSSQAELIAELTDRFPHKEGISRANLENVFASANRELQRD